MSKASFSSGNPHSPTLHSNRWRKAVCGLRCPIPLCEGAVCSDPHGRSLKHSSGLYFPRLCLPPPLPYQSPPFHFHVFFSFSVPSLAFSEPASYPSVAQSKCAPPPPPFLCLPSPSPTCMRSPLPTGLPTSSQQLQSRKVKLIAAPFPSAAFVCST